MVKEQCGKQFGQLPYRCALEPHGINIDHRINSPGGGSVAWNDKFEPRLDDVADFATGETWLQMATRFLA